MKEQASSCRICARRSPGAFLPLSPNLRLSGGSPKMKRVLKWVGYIVGAFIVVIVLAVGTVYAISETRMAKSYPMTVPPIFVPSDSESIARGKHFVESKI